MNRLWRDRFERLRRLAPEIEWYDMIEAGGLGGYPFPEDPNVFFLGATRIIVGRSYLVAAKIHEYDISFYASEEHACHDMARATQAQFDLIAEKERKRCACETQDAIGRVRTLPTLLESGDGRARGAE